MGAIRVIARVLEDAARRALARALATFEWEADAALVGEGGLDLREHGVPQETTRRRLGRRGGAGAGRESGAMALRVSWRDGHGS